MIFFLTVLQTIFVIGLLVFIHELGHFLVAKWCGVGVVKFAVGFGPAICRFRFKETVYQIGIIPLGGFVRMVGDMPDMLTGEQETDEMVRGDDSEIADVQDDNPELYAALQDRSRWFVEKNYWQRSAIVVAGPLFNFLLCIVLSGLAVFMYGMKSTDPTSRIGKVMDKSPASIAGLQDGDVVTAIDGAEIDSWESLAKNIHNGSGKAVNIAVKRNDQQLNFSVTPQQKEIPTMTGEKLKVFVVGIEPTRNQQDFGLFASAEYGVLWTIDKTMLTYEGLWGMITRKVSPKELAGPLFIFKATRQQAERGFNNLLYFTAILSVSLAVLNLLPVPILDGGHLLFFTIEALCGPISIRTKEYAQQVGMLLLLGLMVFALHNDITRKPIDMSSGISWDDEKPKKEAE